MFIALTFFCNYMDQYGLFKALYGLKCLNKLGQIMTVNRPDIPETKLLEHYTVREDSFNSLFKYLCKTDPLETEDLFVGKELFNFFFIVIINVARNYPVKML